MANYKLLLTETFQNRLDKLAEREEELRKKVRATLQKLAHDPHYPGLRSHKVRSRNHGTCWSSWVTGDLRIIWDYYEEDRLIVLDLGGHSGKH